MLNFWATWCGPCLKEIPDLIELQTRYGQQGLQIIGIAIDNEDDVREFAEKAGMNYPIMVSEQAAMELSSAYGNHIGGLPFTAVINRNGEITDTITGALDARRAKKILSSLGLDT
jgi:thiol-disulfide isomerase/thioredoxin